MATIPTDLCELFSQSVDQCPDNLAVDHEDGCLTYRELDEASSALASDLTRLGVEKGSPVLLVTAHGTFNLVAILAILKSGGCFVPIDRRTWSLEMIKYVCDTVDSPVIINTTPEPFAAPDGQRHVLQITKIPPAGSETNCSSTVSRIGSDDVACIIFTSGSTGRPKGVIISHKSLCLYSKTSPLNLDIAPGDRLLHILSVAFDACACMLFSTLANCGTVVPSQPEDIYNKASSCTVIAATPSILSSLPTPTSEDSIFSNMHTIILGGETATSELLGSWIDTGVRVLTGYGVTETTSMGCIHNVERHPQTGEINPLLIGAFMEQSPICLLNSNLSIIEEDVVEGEIVIAGDGVSLGYYKDEVKTKDTFIYWNESRIYRTGDYGRWVRGPAGDRVMEFRGRKDRTVKNRGFLVNLDRDVEDGLYRIGASLGVKSVCAVATEKGIIAVVTPSCVDTTVLLAKAEQSMCAYCIPYRIETVEEIPLSSNGKVQHKKVLDIIATVDEGKDPNDLVVPTASTIFERQSIDKEEEEEKLRKILRAAAEVLACPEDKVQAEDSFVGMGGSSLLALKFVAVLRQVNLQIAVRDIFRCRTFSEMSQHAFAKPCAEQVTTPIAKDPTVAQKLADLRSQARIMLGLSDESFEVGPLTSFQLDLAMPTLLDESRSVNQVKLVYGGTHASMMERAWRAVWQAEPVFRTEICLTIGCGAQIIHKKPFRRPQLEIYASRKDYETAVMEVSMAVGLGCRLEFFAFHPTTAATKAGRRASIPRGTEELTIVLTVHHSLIDGISLKLLLDNVERAAQGRSLHCSPCSINANLGLMAIQKIRDTEAKNFFSEYLKDLPAENLSTERHRISAQRRRQGVEQCMNTVFFESSASVDEVTAFAGQSCVSVACIYYTAWAMAINALEGSKDVIVGAVFSNRATQPDYEDTIGPYMSTLPLVVKLGADQTVAACLQRIMDDLTTISEYAWARADQVGIGRRMGNLLAMQLPLPNERSRPPPMRVESLENSDFPLSFLVEANGSLRALYDTTMFDDRVVRRLGEHFKHSLQSLLHEALVEDCMKMNRVQEMVLEKAEQVRIEAGEQIVKQVLERSIDRFPGEIALEDCSGTKITYVELDRVTNIIAHHINAELLDARAVAIYGDGTTGWILGLLGILKTGRIYAPLDPKWPMDRRAAVCEKSGATAVLLPSTSQRNEVPSDMQVLAVDSILNDEKGQGNVTRLPDTASPDSDLVIVFTSGTTGTPKGIPISNRGFLSLQSNPEATMFAAPGRRIAQFMSPAFDYCNVEIFSALLHGATLVLRDPLNPYAHLAKVNTVTMMPSVLSVIDPNDFPNLEIVYATGEAVTTGLVNKFATRALFYNAYGPAECSICTSFTRMIPGDTVTIGHAIETARMYILDEQQSQAPEGVRGELYLAGIQVLREYINAPEQTLLRILPDPWHEGQRMYRTGDYGMRGKDGRITYMGRIDRQVKIRGYRVELAGVEHAIMSGPSDEDITQCAAFSVNGTLASCLTFRIPLNSVDSEERIRRLRDRLGKLLLPSWVPQIIFSVEEFPRTANGKIDTKVLETLYTTQISSRKTVQSTPSIAPDVEGKLADEWRSVLQLDTNVQLEESDDFFSLGGHSVLIMLLSTRLASKFGVNVTARELLPTPTFGGQISVIRRLLEKKVTASQQTETKEPEDSTTSQTDNLLQSEELTELERQVWFQYQVATSVSAFNIANVLRLTGRFDVDRLMDSLNAALASDPVLRSNLVEGSNGPKRVLRSAPPTVRLVKRLNTNKEVNYRFNLEHDELIRVHLVMNKSEEDDNSVAQLVIVTSHSIADLGTLQNLLQLVSRSYIGTAPMMHVRPRHLDSTRWMHRPSLDEHKFWKDYLTSHGYKDHRSSLLRRSFLSSPLATFHGASRTREFSGRLVKRLNTLMRRLGITHHQIGLAAAALVLQWLSGEDDVIIGAPNANRTSSVEREALGQFLDRLPIRVKISSESSDSTPTTNTVLTEVRDSSRLALANVIPFSNILETLGFPSGALHHPLFECMVTFHPRSARLHNFLQLPECQVSATPMFAHGAKFPLMMEWFELDSDRWSLHIEHNTNHLLPATIDMIEDALEIILEAMGDECSISELHTRLTDLNLPELDSLDESPISSSSSSPRSSKDYAYMLSVEEIASTIQGEMVACLDKGTEKLSRSSSFFSAGADSAAVISLRHRMQKLGFDIPVRAIFVAQSPLKLAEHVLVCRE
ncbi:Nonribosomal peptide synthetase verP [Cladobotryum mycophilum]|uniref:Nonribosomal peptide synthetase verP n=1 Tax=Cladobotryum mycophilum TaxID=491253 RepID=A0ABR0S7Q3_9HYPO